MNQRKRVLVTGGAGSASRFRFRPLPENDPGRRRPDIGLAHCCLGWEPAMPLEKGLQRTLAYFRELLRKSDLAAAARFQ